MGRQKLFNNEKLEIIRMYNEGLNSVQIAELFNVKTSTITKILNKYSVEIRNRTIPDDVIFEIKRRIDTGETLKEIAYDYNVTLSAISHRVKRWDKRHQQ